MQPWLNAARNIAALLIAVAACAKAPEPEPDPVRNDATVRTTTSGQVVGFTARSGAHAWRGIHFAADTGFENRWRAPQPRAAWSGIKEALDYGPVCPQIATPFTPVDSFVEGALEGSEDCLVLDIYAPADAQGKDLPVMLWIHGGANVSGTTQLYSGDVLAAREDVIVVAAQYRLGPLGFFSHEALANSAETERDRAANFALLDQTAALEWIRDNAAAFGGDPDNVTVFGESAGGHNIYALLVSPLTEGLFHRAIIQSGLTDSVSISDAQGATGDEQNPSDQVSRRLGGPEMLRKASLDEVFEAYDVDGGVWMELPRMIEDGVSIPEVPLREAISDPARLHDVPLITGTNRDEMKLFYAFDDSLTATRFGLFRVPRDQEFYDALAYYSGRAWRVAAVDQPAAQMRAAGRNDVYAYRFDWDEQGSFLFMDFSKLLGAAHAMEIPFVFGRFEFFDEADAFVWTKKTEESRVALSEAITGYWASFARTGVPAVEGAPVWTPYGERAAVLHLDSSRDKGIRIETGGDNYRSIISDLSKDDAFTAEERCLIAEGLWMTDADAAELVNEIMACADDRK
ncbi:MAG: carboxylesterase family protein [Pseudomonadota bacterium]